MDTLMSAITRESSAVREMTFATENLEIWEDGINKCPNSEKMKRKYDDAKHRFIDAQNELTSARRKLADYILMLLEENK